MIEEFFKRIAAEATSFEIGLLGALISIGYVAGAFLHGASWLPGDLQALSASTWSLVLAGFTYGVVLMMRSARDSRRLALSRLEEDSMAVSLLKSEVDGTLKDISIDIDAYKSRSRYSDTDRVAFDFEKFSRDSGRKTINAQPHQLLELVRADLLNVYDLFMSDQVDSERLRSARSKAVDDRIKVRSGFGLPATRRLLEMNERLERSEDGRRKSVVELGD